MSLSRYHCYHGTEFVLFPKAKCEYGSIINSTDKMVPRAPARFRHSIFGMVSKPGPHRHDGEPEAQFGTSSHGFAGFELTVYPR
jgi:hypothetical protein